MPRGMLAPGGPDDPLIYVRAVHYAATITMAGLVFFVVLIAA
jgi:hypothetical protein